MLGSRWFVEEVYFINYIIVDLNKSASDISVKVKVVSIERLPWIGSGPAF